MKKTFFTLLKALAAIIPFSLLALCYAFAAGVICRCIYIGWHAGLRFLLPLCLCASVVHSTNVMLPLAQMYGGAQYAKSVTLTAQHPAITDGVNLYVGTSIQVTPTGGTNPIVQMEPNNYMLTFADARAPLHFGVPFSTNTLNVLNLITNGLMTFTNWTSAGGAASSLNFGANNNISIGWSAPNTYTTSSAPVLLAASANPNVLTLGFGVGLTTNTATASGVVAIGNYALGLSTTQLMETVVGNYSLFSLQTGEENTAFGEQTADGMTDGSDNVFVGWGAGWQIVSGSQNVMIGSKSLFTSVDMTPNNDIVIGYLAGSGWTSAESGNILIGSPGVVNDQNLIRLGTPGIHTDTFLAGDIHLSGTIISTNGPGASATVWVQTNSAGHGLGLCFTNGLFVLPLKTY